MWSSNIGLFEYIQWLPHVQVLKAANFLYLRQELHREIVAEVFDVFQLIFSHAIINREIPFLNLYLFSVYLEGRAELLELSS